MRALLPLAVLGIAACWDWSFPPELLREDAAKPISDARAERADATGSDARTEAGPDAKPDAPASDAPLDGPKADGVQADTRKPDGPSPDSRKPDGPKPDTTKADLPKPDLPKPDLPKPDLPKPDLLLSCGGGCTGAGKSCVNGVCVVTCGGAGCSCPANEPRCKLVCNGAGKCTNNITCTATVSCEIECRNGACTGELKCSGAACVINCSGSNTCTNVLRCTPSKPCSVVCTSNACTNDIWCDNACPCGVSCGQCQKNKIHCTKTSCEVATGCDDGDTLPACALCP